MKINMLEEKPPMGSKRLRTLKPDKNSSKRLKNQLDNDENDDNQLSDNEILNESIDFCMPKPGPHAKVCHFFVFLTVHLLFFYKSRPASGESGSR